MSDMPKFAVGDKVNYNGEITGVVYRVGRQEPKGRKIYLCGWYAPDPDATCWAWDSQLEAW